LRAVANGSARGKRERIKGNRSRPVNGGLAIQLTSIPSMELTFPPFWPVVVNRMFTGRSSCLPDFTTVRTSNVLVIKRSPLISISLRLITLGVQPTSARHASVPFGHTLASGGVVQWAPGGHLWLLGCLLSIWSVRRLHGGGSDSFLCDGLILKGTVKGALSTIHKCSRASATLDAAMPLAMPRLRPDSRLR
jgi:hypothetical protein